MTTQDHVIREEQILTLIRVRLEAKERELDDYAIILFGSRAAGDERERSDFDIGIVGEEPVPAKLFFELETLLDRIPTLYTIDFGDLNRAPQRFCEEALKSYRLLYGKTSIIAR